MLDVGLLSWHVKRELGILTLSLIFLTKGGKLLRTIQIWQLVPLILRIGRLEIIWEPFVGNWLLAATTIGTAGNAPNFGKGGRVIKESDWFGHRVNYTHRAFDVVPHLLNDGGLSVKCEVSVMLVIGVCWAAQTLPPINFPPPGHQTTKPRPIPSFFETTPPTPVFSKKIAPSEI